MKVTVADVIARLQTLPQDMEVWEDTDESCEYFAATKIPGRVDWIHQATRTDGRTWWRQSYTGQQQGKAVCVLQADE
jgi:hypothetical protein